MAKTNIRVRIIGADGNVFNLLGICRRALSRAGKIELWDEFRKEATSGLQACRYLERLIVNPGLDGFVVVVAFIFSFLTLASLMVVVVGLSTMGMVVEVVVNLDIVRSQFLVIDEQTHEVDHITWLERLPIGGRRLNISRIDHRISHILVIIAAA